MEIAILVPIIILIGVNIVLIYSKCGIKRVNEIQLTPPEDMNTLELAYINNKKVTTSDVISLIPYLVDKGYIKMEFPFKPNSNNKVCNFKIIKNKEYDGNNALERYLLKRLFEKGNIITYYELCNNLEYKALFAACTEFVNSDRNYNIIFNTKNKKIKRIVNICAMIGLFIFDCIFNIGYIVFYIFQILLLTTISSSMNGSDVGVSIGNGPTNLKRNSFKVTLVLSVVLLILSIPFMLVSTENNTVMRSGKECMIYLLGIIMFIIIYLIKIHIDKRNKYGEELYQKTKQFKDFLRLTPRESIEAQFNNNKDCYFDIFSYCFVLGMSDKCTTEYDKFFNNVYKILYEATTNNRQNVNNVDVNYIFEEYNTTIKKEYEEFNQMINLYNDKFLGKEITSNGIKIDNYHCENMNVFSEAIKKLKKWIIES